MQYALSLIAAAKIGIMDSEMLDLLAQDPSFHSSATYGKHITYVCVISAGEGDRMV